MGYPHPSHPKETVLLSKYFGDPGARTYAGWVERGGYAGLRKALAMPRADVIEIVKQSGLRGRGGAGKTIMAGLLIKEMKIRGLVQVRQRSRGTARPSAFPLARTIERGSNRRAAIFISGG